MKKFRMYYYYTADHKHWTLIKQSDKPEDIINYIQDNLSELEDAFDENVPKYFEIRIYNTYNECEKAWQGDPYELLEDMKYYLYGPVDWVDYF